MNKPRVLSLLALAAISMGRVQAADPVKWTFTVEQKNSDEAMLVFHANIEKGWHIYSQFTPDGGPLPTVFTFEANGCYQLDGKATEPKPYEEFDSTFEVKVLTLDGKPTFTQKIKLKDGSCSIKGRVDGQVCKDVCIMFGSDFTFNIGKFKEEVPSKN